MCANDEFESSAPTRTENRQCKKLTVCDANKNKYEMTKPTQTTDRKCGSCHPQCNKCSGPLNTDCETCRNSKNEGVCVAKCPAGKFSDENGDCQLSNPCVAGNLCGENAKCLQSGEGEHACECADGYFGDGNDCAKWKVCAEDEYELDMPTKESDRVCAKHTPCKSSEFEAAAPTETTDRVCEPVTECENGYFESSAPTQTVDRQCTKCTSCAADEFQSTPCKAKEDTTCDDLRDCDLEVEYVSKKATAVSDRECKALKKCASNEYYEEGATEFEDRVCMKLTECTEAEYELVQPTQSSNRVCATHDVCHDGSFQVAGTGTLAVKRVCAPLESCAAEHFALDLSRASVKVVCGSVGHRRLTGRRANSVEGGLCEVDMVVAQRNVSKPRFVQKTSTLKLSSARVQIAYASRSLFAKKESMKLYRTR